MRAPRIASWSFSDGARRSALKPSLPLLEKSSVPTNPPRSGRNSSRRSKPYWKMTCGLAIGILKTKNRLSADDAKRVEDAFATRMALRAALPEDLTTDEPAYGRSPADAHHLRFTQPRAMGRKVSDEFTVPLYRTHHRDNHRFGDEAAWWVRQAIEAVETSRRLWVPGPDTRGFGPH
jgi:hypothetical protein